jgi:hypothetical protein
MTQATSPSTHVAIDVAPAVLWGFYSDQDWQRSLNGLAAYDAIDKMIGKAQTCTCPQISWAWGYNPDGSVKYQQFYAPRLDADRKKGRISMMTWMSMNGGDRNNPTQQQLFNNESIIKGVHDPYIIQFAKDAAAYGHKFVMRFDPEMNGWWEGPFAEYNSSNQLQYGNTDGSFVRMWSHVYNIVHPIAPNILWYWCANPLSSGSGNPTYTGKLGHFLPPDSQVDFVGYDVYNKASDGPNSPWKTFVECLEGSASGWPVNSVAPLLALAPGKKWILGEVGCGPMTAGDTTPGAGDRAKWASDMLDAIRTRYPFIVAWQYFNVAPYTMDAAMAAGFAKGLSNPSYPVAPLLDTESVVYRVVSTPDLDAQIANAQAAVQSASASLTSLQTQLKQTQDALTAAQAVDTADDQQIADLNNKLTAANAAAVTATQHATAAEQAMATVQQNIQGMLQFAQAPIP